MSWSDWNYEPIYNYNRIPNVRNMTQIYDPVRPVDKQTQLDLYNSVFGKSQYSWGNDVFRAEEAPVYADSAANFERLEFGEVASLSTVPSEQATSSLQGFEEQPIEAQTSTVDTLPMGESSKTFNWDAVWNPATSFATDSAATEQNLADASASIPIQEVASDMVEGAEVAADIGSGGILLGAQMIGQALDGVTNAITGNKISNYNIGAQQNFNTAMTTGHGIGYQNVAEMNLMNAYNASANYKGFADTMTSLLGPFGGLIAAMSPVDTPQVTTSYEANTVSGAQINSQAADVIATASQ